MKVNNFDVLKAMSAENKDIRMATMDNFAYMQKTKHGTRVSVGVEGDVIVPITTGELVGCLLLWNKKQFDEMKKKLETEADAV